MVINVRPLWKYVTEAIYFSYFGAILVQFVASGHMWTSQCSKGCDVLQRPAAYVSTLHSCHGHSLVQDFAESLQHYTKMHKAKYADRSIYGAQVRLQYVLLITLPAANYNLSLLKRLNLGL